MRPMFFATVALLVLVLASACGSAPTPVAPIAVAPTTAAPTVAPRVVARSGAVGKQFEELNPGNFARPTVIDNEWFPMKPGTQYVFEGFTIEEGQAVHHRLTFTVTDLTKVIGGVRTVVAWIVDYSNDELIEKEIAFYAQDNDGAVWYLGEYPEEYEGGNFVQAPAWIHGLEGSMAGIQMEAKPRVGMPSYSAGWAPSVGFTDRSQIEQFTGTNVPFGGYAEVLVIAETSQAELALGAYQLKYYARGVGKVRVGWRGDDAKKETLELVNLVQLKPEELARVRAQALDLERSAYEKSKDMYGKTVPMESK